jgi:hypothetical protein
MKYTIAMALFLLPAAALAQADLRIDAADIRFSKDPLVAGDSVRLYATVRNEGDVDVSGYVSFYQGATLIGSPVVISVLAGGNPEEVYVDFVVPSGRFNVLAMIQGTDPEDANIDNNSAITSMREPIKDDDRDGIANENDRCPVVADSSQTDTDLDGQGDACDEDDDNDGLSDGVEIELQTSPTVTDSDGDGVVDSDDAYPLDPDRTVHQEIPPQTPSAPPAVESETFKKIVQEIAQRIQSTGEEATRVEGVEPAADQIQEPQAVSQEPVHVSPNAIFSYQRLDWNRFTFEVLSASLVPMLYVWDFGDGVSSSKSSVEHQYNRSGAFTITLAMTDVSGAVQTESTTVLVPFFHLGNRLIMAALVLLGLLLLAGVGSFVRLGSKRS